MSEHEEEAVVIQPPTWRFSLWDVPGIAFNTLGGVFHALSMGSHLMSQEFGAMANYSRNAYDEWEAEKRQEEARQEMANSLDQWLATPPEEER